MKFFVLMLVAFFSIPATVAAQTTNELLFDTKKSQFSYSVGTELSNAYFFRGLPQLKDQIVVTPNADLTYDLSLNRDGVLNDVRFVGSTKAVLATDNQSTYSDNSWAYEVDLVGGVRLDLADNWLTFGTDYALYNSPSNSFETVHEFVFSLELNDLRLWDNKLDNYVSNFTGLRPYTLYAYELDGTRGLGGDTGGYLEFGVNPGFSVYNDVLVTLPLRVGYGIDSYFGEDSDFGFVGVGPQIVVPTRVENLFFTTGVEFQFSSSNLQDRTDNGNVETIATVGLVFKK